MKRKHIGGILLAGVLLLAAIIPVCVGAARAATTSEPMKISDEMMSVLKDLEGFNPHAYWDYKQWSIGYGSKCPEGMEDYYREDREGNEISLEYAEELLRGELDYFERELNGFINHFDLTLTQNQYDALVSFSYNVGASWMRDKTTWEYKNTGNLNSAIIDGDTGTRMIYGLMLWSMAGGEHILIGRRTVEMNVFANGVYDADARPDRYRIAFMDPNGGTVNYDEHGFDTQNPVPIRTTIKSRPTGPDENGETVTYEFDGWYTERVGGTKVEMLDESIPTGAMLFAHWKTPSGTPVEIPRPDTGMQFKVTVTATNLNIRSGPQTYFHSFGKATTGDTFEITNVVTRGGSYWGQSGDRWICLDSTSYSRNYTDYKAVKDEMLPMWGKITATTLRVRKDAGTDYDEVAGATKVKDDMVLIEDWKSDGSIMWGKIEEGWIALPYVTFEGVKSIEISQKPTKLTYAQNMGQLDLSGGKLLVTFVDQSTATVDITPEMVTGFDNTKLGTNTLTITYGEQTVQLEVEIKEPPKGDYNGDLLVNDRDALYLLGYTLFPGDYPITAAADVNGDGNVNDRDALYLLGYTLFPEDYPLTF